MSEDDRELWRNHEELVVAKEALLEERSQHIKASLTDLLDIAMVEEEVSNKLQIGHQALASIAIHQVETDSLKPWSRLQEEIESVGKSMKKDKIQHRKAINARVLKMLREDVPLPTSVRLVCYLRDQADDPDMSLDKTSLPSVYLQCRETFLTNLIISRDPTKTLASNPSEAFRILLSIMSDDVLEILRQYKASFDDFQQISIFLTRRFAWFFEALHDCMENCHDPNVLAIFWRRLEELDTHYSKYMCSFVPFIKGEVLNRVISLALVPLHKAVPLFIAALDRTVVTEGSTLKSTPAFVILMNSISETLSKINQLNIPEIFPYLERRLIASLKPVEIAIERESGKFAVIKDIYDKNFTDFLQSKLNSISSIHKDDTEVSNKDA